jgi:hypothetical protein
MRLAALRRAGTVESGSGRHLGKESIYGRTQLGGLTRQIAGGGQHQVRRPIGIFTRRGRSSYALRDAGSPRSRLPDIPGYVRRCGILLVDGGGNRSREAVDISHDSCDGSNIVDGLLGRRLYLGDLRLDFLGCLCGLDNERLDF